MGKALAAQTAGGAEAKVATLQKNKPAQLVFLVPAGLVIGAYYLEVRARMRALADLCTGRLDAVLTV